MTLMSRSVVLEAAKAQQQQLQLLQPCTAASLLSVSLGCELLQAAPGRLTVQLDARLAHDAQVGGPAITCSTTHGDSTALSCWSLCNAYIHWQALLLLVLLSLHTLRDACSMLLMVLLLLRLIHH